MYCNLSNKPLGAYFYFFFGGGGGEAYKRGGAYLKIESEVAPI